MIETANSHPGATALSAGPKRITFGDLAARSTALASCLISLGAKPEVPIALCLERSFDFVVSALAVILSGAAYLPLDPIWPAERIRKILDHAQAPLVIASGGSPGDRIAGSATRAVVLDQVAVHAEPSMNLPRVDVTPETLAYLIYTSGFTGEPKCVEVTHANLSNLVAWHQSAFAITSRDRASHVAGIGFDAAVWEIWPHLAAGATVVLADEDTRTSADLLREWLVREQITVAFVPTILAERLLADRWPAECPLRYLLTGGEALHRHPSPGLPFTVVNNYGPTECTVVATSGVVSAGGQEGLPPTIGKPIAGTQVRILVAGCSAARGQVGEIFISGAGVARGYRNNPAATAERFVPDPSGLAPGSRMYRTGDLGCLLPDGQILFRGRIDDQEQIQGHRVEPDEIVCALNRHPAIAASAVIAHGQTSAKSLVAYIVPRQQPMPSSSELREFVSLTLPHYMIPSIFVQLTGLPLNSNGKLDRAALPEPSAENRMQNSTYRAPTTPTEERLSQILASALGVDRIGLDDNFFILGFHSLIATHVAARVCESFDVQATLRDLFEAPTVALLAAKVDLKLIEKLNSMSDEEVSQRLAL